MIFYYISGEEAPIIHEEEDYTIPFLMEEKDEEEKKV